MCILSPIFLKEKLPKEAIPGLVVIALGTLCVVQIWNFDSFNVYALFGIGGGFFSAAAYIVISMLAERILNQIRKLFSISRFSVSP